MGHFFRNTLYIYYTLVPELVGNAMRQMVEERGLDRVHHEVPGVGVGEDVVLVVPLSRTSKVEEIVAEIFHTVAVEGRDGEHVVEAGPAQNTFIIFGGLE